MRKISFIFVLAFFLSIGMERAAFSQEQAPVQPVAQVPLVPEQQEADILWLWGEVVAVDAQSSQVTVKYLDYETDQEKEMTVAVDAKTTFENVKSLAEVKAKDTISIDYVAGPEGKNIAKNISIEKIEGMQELTAEDMPKELFPPELPANTPSTTSPEAKK